MASSASTVASQKDLRHVLVTGGSSGIGLALCKQLVSKEYGCYVYLTARNKEKGERAVEEVIATTSSPNISLILLDVSSPSSVTNAATTLKNLLPEGVSLYALVNNAGTGFAHGVDSKTIMTTNLHGPKLVVEAFLPLLQKDGGRIVNVGSKGGPEYVAKLSQPLQKQFTNPSISWDQIKKLSQQQQQQQQQRQCDIEAYCLSKALLACYTLLLAREHPQLKCFCLNPGFIDTNMSKGYGARLKPEEGTVSLRHCLFGAFTSEQNGWFFESDGKRSALHQPRDVGTPEYDGALPW